MRLARYLLVCCLVAGLSSWAAPALRAGEEAKASVEVHQSYLRELFAILDETKSPDAFMLTLRCLDDDKADPRELIPAAIRNAERLGILADHAGKEGRKVDRAECFAELLERVHARMAKAVAPVACERHEVEAPDVQALHGLVADVIDEGPDDAAVLRELPSQPCCLSWLYESSRDDVRIVKELIVDKHRDPLLIGEEGRQHHCRWKCTVYYNETIAGCFPLPFKYVRPRVEVVYVDDDKE